MTRYTQPFLLSAHGSTRATAYQFGNKSVTLDGKTHVVWLDAVARVRGRTFDHSTGEWGGPIDLFEGCDNHTNPALIADAEGRLRMAYGPHGWWGNWNYGCFKYAVSEEPGSVKTLRDHSMFGYNATYACLVATPSGLDCIVYRGGEQPSALVFQKQRANGGWGYAQPLMTQDITPQYTHVGGHITCAKDGTLYVTGHFYNAETDNASLGVAVLKSSDLGATWADLNGEPAAVPILLEPRFAAPSPSGHPYSMGVVTDSDNRLWIGTFDATPASRSALISCWTGSEWRTTDLAPFVPADYTIVYAGLTIDTADRLHVAATGLGLRNDVDTDTAWGRPSCEVFHLVSRDGGTTFECNQVSPSDPSMANWLPNIALPGLHNPVERPVILYTRGLPGEGCSPPTETEAWCVMVEDLG